MVGEMNTVYIAKQKIFNKKNSLFAYELLFRDNKYDIRELKSNIQATSHVLLNVLTNINIDQLLGEGNVAFINVDEAVLTSGILDLLDNKRFVLEILETTELSNAVVSSIIQYHKRGFKIAIDDFDCSAEMIKKFTPLFKYINLIKMDVLIAEPENLKNVVAKFQKMGIKILAEKIETEEDYNTYLKMGFDLYQGFHLDRPKVIELDNLKDATRYTIMQLIKLIRNDGTTQDIEHYIKQQTDLSYKLIKFINNQDSFDAYIESITQIITLLGRDRLLRWLLLYLYSEMSTDAVSQSIMNIAIKRAEKMEADTTDDQKDKAYLAGMFTLLDALFEADMKDIMQDIKMDKDVSDLVLTKKGRFSSSLIKAEISEKEYLKKLLINNFDKIDIIDIVYALELNGVPIDPEQL